MCAHHDETTIPVLVERHFDICQFELGESVLPSFDGRGVDCAVRVQMRCALAAMNLPILASGPLRVGPVTNEGERQMSVARVTEIIASSTISFEDAVEQGVKRASETLKNVEGAWVKDQKATVKDGKISEYRVVLKVTFILQ